MQDLWLPILVVLAGAVVSANVSIRSDRERQEQILRAAEAIAAESRELVSLKIQKHLTAVQDLADSWARFGRTPLPKWTEDAQLVMKNVPGFSYVAWVSPGDDATRIARAPDAPEPEALDEEEARAHARAPAVVGPLRRSDGGFAYRLYQPVPGGGGVLAAGVDADRLLFNVLRGSATGYAISVLWDGREIVTRGRASNAPGLGWWRIEGAIPLATGTSWRVVHAPTAELARSLLTPFPQLLLVGGLLLSLAAGAIVYQLQRLRRDGRLLAEANRALDQGMREARAGEASLRRLSEELEQRVHARTKQLEDTLGDLEAFNFSVSHDLRSPIGAVLNFVAILEEEHASELTRSARELVTRIRGSAERAIGLLEGLLKLSRAGRVAIEIEALDMTALAREAFLQARGSASEESDLEFALDPLPAARGDRALIGSVFVNLIGNAIKYTRGREKRRITVSGGTAEAANVYSVTDNGIGFDSRFAAKLFGAFERLHPSDQFEGAGIGLAIVARIVQRHGGRVWADGTPEQGASFFFSLPSGEGKAS